MLSSKKNATADRRKPRSQKLEAQSHLKSSELEPNEATRVGVLVFALVMFFTGFAVVFFATLWVFSPITIIASIAVGLLVASCIRISPQWERVAILRFGNFNRVAGPGIYLLIPLFEYTAIHVDQRIMTSAFSAEAALTADLVPVDVDAVYVNPNIPKMLVDPSTQYWLVFPHFVAA